MTTLEELILATDMTCEAHPWLPWPHDDCIGPGMPWRVSVAMLRRLMEDPPVTGTAVGGFLTCEATGCGRPATQLARFTTGETMATCDDDAPARFASGLPNHPQSLVVRSRHPLVAEQWEWPGGIP